MNAIQNDAPEIAPSAELARSPPLLRTLVAVDLVESTALTDQLGDRSIADIMHLLDRHARDLLERHGGIEIDKTDGFLLMFDRPIPAVAFALDYQRLLHDMSLSEFLPLQARIGIHVGDVVLWRNAANDIARGAKPMEVEGLVKPVAARLAGLALPGQILLSGVARALALRAQDELKIDFPPEWRMHGRYIFKGVGEPVPVFEVGEVGIAPLRSPAYSSKAFREVPWFRRPALLAIEAAIVLAAILVPAWIFLRSPPVIAFAERDWVVVGSLKNLTDEHRFDDALDTAFRLGLEQSRYVNVLSDLKVRETLALMQRDPEKTSVDRVVGSEIAIRDGARAFVLPTVSEVGRNVRITAEVIDPGSQTTVYTESAEGIGSESVLTSVNQISLRLRERLGEALATVSKDSQPLDKAATGNLDALRAFSLAQQAYDTGKYSEAMKLYNEALSLDPGFAIARAHSARLLLASDKRGEAVKQLDKALDSRERLNPRDKLYVEAWRSSLVGSQREALDRWKVLAKLYPDYFTAQSTFAYFSFEFANSFGEDVVAAAERSSSYRNPHPLANDMLLGLLYLSNEQIDRSIKQFEVVERESAVNHFVTALPFAAQRKFALAEASLGRKKPTEDPGISIGRYIPLIAIAYDQGSFDGAWTLLKEAREKSLQQVPRYALIYRGIELGLKVLTERRGAITPLLNVYADELREALQVARETDKHDVMFQMLFAAYLAAREDNIDLARQLLRDAGAETASGDWPVLQKIRVIAEAEILRSEGKLEQALEKLRPQVDGTELCLAHVALMDIYAAKKDAAAKQEAQWLATHRGRAYAENYLQSMLMPINVAFSNIAASENTQKQSASKR